MDERRAEEAIKALNKAGAIKVGTAEGTPVSREHAKEIVQAIRKQKRDELDMDDIVNELELLGRWQPANRLVFTNAIETIERLRETGNRIAMHLDAHYGTGSPMGSSTERALADWRKVCRD